MPLFQPTNVIPSSLSGFGNGVIDVTDLAVVSWTLNGNSPLVAYRVSCYTNDAASNLVFDFPGSSFTVLPFPIQPKDGNGNPNMVSFALNSSWAALGLTNGNNYKIKIWQVWGNSTSNIDYNNVVAQYSESAFVTRAHPTIAISFPPIFVDRPSYTFNASYSQEQGDAINWCRWKVEREIESGVFEVIEDTGEIYTSDLTFTYNGFINGEWYRVSVEVETQNGDTATYVTAEFDGRFNVLSSQQAIGVMELADSSVLISSPFAPVYIEPNEFEQGAVAFYNNVLYLRSGNSIVWDKSPDGNQFLFSAPYTFFLRLQKTVGPGIVEFGNITVTITDSQIAVKITANGDDKTTTSGISRYQYIDLWITPSGVRSVAYDENWNYKNYGYIEFPTGYAPTDIDDLSIYGPLNIYYMGVFKGDVSNFLNFTPVFDQNTYALTNFQSSNLGLSSCLYTPIHSLYRKTEGALSFVSKIDFSTSKIKDFGTRSAKSYEYQIFSETNGDFSISAVSSPVCKQLNAYYLIEAQQDQKNPGVYHALKVWRFGNNISSGSISNNNTPAWQTNFTPYRLRQQASRMGKSGTLLALLSNVKDAEYFDTTEMQERLYAASASTNVFFLKDMKGNLYMVHISAPIVQSINISSKVQQVTVSIPWEEIGDASKALIIQTPDDDGWMSDMVGQVKLDVDVETGMLIATYPDQYYGTVFFMQNEDLYARTPAEFDPPGLTLQDGTIYLTE